MSLILKNLYFINNGGNKMKINLNDILVNSYDRDMKELIVIYDNKDNVETFTYDNIPDHIKHMKIERFYVASEKLTIIKVEGIINE